MDEIDKKLTQERYKDRLKKFGSNIKALASGTEERRETRFEVLTEIGIYDGVSVLDVGCGLADYYHYLIKKGLNIKYTGIDIVPELIESAREKYPELNLQVRDIQNDPYDQSSFDYVVCSQVFNLRMVDGKNMSLVNDMLKEMFEISKYGLAVDFITNYVDFEQEHLFYYKPEELFSIAKQLTKRVTLRHDYPSFEFCLYLYPNFEGWSESVS
jgi:ubiquinone/menaquinone biosynthesis C-methylase UbiE